MENTDLASPLDDTTGMDKMRFLINICGAGEKKKMSKKKGVKSESSAFDNAHDADVRYRVAVLGMHR